MNLSAKDGKLLNYKTDCVFPLFVLHVSFLCSKSSDAFFKDVQ